MRLLPPAAFGLAPDDKSLYYHVKDSSGVFVINRVSRP